MYMLTVMQSDLMRCTYECLKKNPSVVEALSRPNRASDGDVER